MNLTSKELSGQHIGKTVSIIVQDAFFRDETHTGTLHAVSHETETENVGNGDWIARTSSRSYVDITLGIARIEGIPHNTPITIQEDK